ncbi:response regulator [Niabella hibiscisoli]|uniref:response regulator n=1 Tax=Niabella hibiscisoli TaxID=1825928 RepID=UPI001F0F5CD5|nr:response regulator [Niabella hibiscisoli]MCH5719566.1 response regulator [Niabella hibiscisoli]
MPSTLQLLIVDDDSVYKLVMRKMIAHCCNHVDILFADNGREGLELLQTAVKDPSIRLPDIIFLDIEMPEINGWEFLEMFSKLPESVTKMIKIYVATSSITPEDKYRINDYPIAQGLMEKPIPLETMKRILHANT